MNAQRRDGNEAVIVAALRAAGAFVIKMDRLAGFDLLVLFRDYVYIVEVKEPASKGDLTPSEKSRMIAVILSGVEYHIVTTPEEALQVIGR